jgi:hypothetical protein
MNLNTFISQLCKLKEAGYGDSPVMFQRGFERWFNAKEPIALRMDEPNVDSLFAKEIVVVSI